MRLGIVALLLSGAHATDLSTYLAGNANPTAVALDGEGNIYVAGIANSDGLGYGPKPVPECPAPPCRDEIQTRGVDAFVIKLSPDPWADLPVALAVEAQGVEGGVAGVWRLRVRLPSVGRPVARSCQGVRMTVGGVEQQQPPVFFWVGAGE